MWHAGCNTVTLIRSFSSPSSFLFHLQNQFYFSAEPRHKVLIIIIIITGVHTPFSQIFMPETALDSGFIRVRHHIPVRVRGLSSASFCSQATSSFQEVSTCLLPLPPGDLLSVSIEIRGAGALCSIANRSILHGIICGRVREHTVSYIDAEPSGARILSVLSTAICSTC